MYVPATGGGKEAFREVRAWTGTVRVVDLSDEVAGRFAAKLLAMGGADVVRLGPGSPVDDRPVPLDRGDAVFLDTYLDAGSRLHGPVEAAIEAADVVLTSYRQGRWTAGWSEEDIRRTTATAVHVTTGSFGTTGPYRDHRGGSLVDWAAGGYLFITGEPDREPLAGPEHLCAYVAGYTAAIAVEAGLAQRAVTGRGLHVDVSTMEAMLAMHQSTFSRLGAGILRERTGRYTEVYPLVVRPCRDGYVSLGLNTDEEFDRFLVALDRVDLAADPRFADRQARAAHRDELDAEVDPILATRDADDLVDLLQSHRIPAAKVVSGAELLADPQLAARGFWHEPEIAGRTGRMPGNPVPRARPAPRAAPTEDDSAAPRRREPADLPLEGTLVLDLTMFWAGPSATRVLADLGARVVRIERPGSRIDAPAHPDEPMVIVQEVFFHRKMNRNKESLVLDLKTPAGLDVALELAARADVLVENFRPGALDALGLGVDALATRNPHLVHVSLSGFGARGPRAWWGSYGPTIEAASSIEARTGYPGGPPLRLGHTLPDGVGGLVGALGALRGLRERREAGLGSHLDLSQLEAYAAIAGEAVLATSVLGTFPERIGNGSWRARAQGVYRCGGEDEWVAVTLEDDTDVDRLAELAGLPGLASTTDERPFGPAALHEVLARFAAGRPKADVAKELQDAGIAAFPVLTPRDLVDDAHLAHRDAFTPMEFAGATVRLPGSPLRATPPLVRTAGEPPRVGEHGAAVLRDLLGLDDAAIADLVARGAVWLPAPGVGADR